MKSQILHVPWPPFFCLADLIETLQGVFFQFFAISSEDVCRLAFKYLNGIVEY